MSKYRSKGAHKNSREGHGIRKRGGGGDKEERRGEEHQTGLPAALDLGGTYYCRCHRITFSVLGLLRR